MATGETITLNAAHAPSERAILAFEKVEDDIKTAILESRKDWDRHEPRMWKTASQTSDEDLVNFNIKVRGYRQVPGAGALKARAPICQDDLVVVRSAVTSYGPIILGKIRIRAIKLDASGELVPGPVEKNADGSIKVEMNHGKVNDELYGYMFVRIHDPLGEGMDNIKFHSLFTDEGKDVEGNQNGKYCAIQHNSKPLEFFHE
ncbi:hypothetical protein MKEN_00694500 [Mycena kentingensis (nom. inval.)]|nr:hypothetical protein MKEN_00694500 [Mycena kentingensis (nom. inval.)]